MLGRLYNSAHRAQHRAPHEELNAPKMVQSHGVRAVNSYRSSRAVLPTLKPWHIIRLYDKARWPACCSSRLSTRAVSPSFHYDGRLQEASTARGVNLP